ncbi:hypothetical protein [Butyrivibrio sp. JL13D10]|uniref:hypothetical protein n=1 Tax=Butyrivibrio sp. JL13D10 TaxID=3236815 RepID=UPI0038B68A49
MEYYAATLREPGKKLNNDGLMIKGIRKRENQDTVVMVLSSDKKDAKLNDRIIRAAEKMVYKAQRKECHRALEQQLHKLFCGFGGGRLLFIKKWPDIMVIVINGMNYHIMNNGENRVVKVDRFDAEEIVCEKVSSVKGALKRGGFCYIKGSLHEGSTIIAATPSFFERQLRSDIHKRLCPQMCIDSETMQENIEALKELLKGRGEERPVTACALCMK